jgi:hypothetical protein
MEKVIFYNAKKETLRKMREAKEAQNPNAKHMLEQLRASNQRALTAAKLAWSRRINVITMHGDPDPGA